MALAAQTDMTSEMRCNVSKIIIVNMKQTRLVYRRVNRGNKVVFDYLVRNSNEIFISRSISSTCGLQTYTLLITRGGSEQSYIFEAL